RILRQAHACRGPCRSGISQDVDGRDDSAFTRVFRRAMPGHFPGRPHRHHIFTPCSARYFTAPGCQGIGEFFIDWFSSVMFLASACTAASSWRFSMKVLTMSYAVLSVILALATRMFWTTAMALSLCWPG